MSSVSEAHVAVAGRELTATQRHMYSQAPDAEFFQNFQTAYDRLTQDDQPSTDVAARAAQSDDASSLVAVLGATQTELADLRGVTVDEQRAYAKILDDAYASGGLNDPRQFLQSLSSADLEVVRRIRSLADTIIPATLSEEGAENLLLPEGYSVDLNQDGMEEVGLARTLHFPPRDAPPEFTAAWFQATQDSDFGDYATRAMTFLFALHPPTETGATVTGLPPDKLDSYRTVVDSYLYMLEHWRGQLPAGQYERDQPFFSRLQELLSDG